MVNRISYIYCVSGKDRLVWVLMYDKHNHIIASTIAPTKREAVVRAASKL